MEDKFLIGLCVFAMVIAGIIGFVLFPIGIAQTFQEYEDDKKMNYVHTDDGDIKFEKYYIDDGEYTFYLEDGTIFKIVNPVIIESPEKCHLEHGH